MTDDDALLAEIDAMDRLTMARLWRFAPSGDPRLSGDAGKHFAARFKSLGGWDPALSKEVGW